jgi:hypothetical protein
MRTSNDELGRKGLCLKCGKAKCKCKKGGKK